VSPRGASNVVASAMPKMSTRRKLALATWDGPREGNIYGKLTVDASRAMAWLDEQRQKGGEKVTITHLVGKAVALALRREPTLNGRIAWGAYVPHETVDISYLVVLEDGSDLAKVKICEADKKSISELAKELRERAGKVRKGQDSEFEKSKGLIRLLPTWLLKPILTFTGWLTGSLGVSLPALGLEPFPFGSAVITSVGMMGLDEGFAPPTPFARVPLLVLVGAVRDAPVVQDGQVVVSKLLTITATIDHRFIDGYQGAILAKAVREIFEHPENLESSAR
ncbi:MAG TPA: 2-oxo acid dehydrogenase subunit E2, partial [Myxococcota bacterium]|nr:2-oxo acid dehydrogenase subunit E2 [Myxococcota bacterium]